MCDLTCVPCCHFQARYRMDIRHVYLPELPLVKQFLSSTAEAPSATEGEEGKEGEALLLVLCSSVRQSSVTRDIATGCVPCSNVPSLCL